MNIFIKNGSRRIKLDKPERAAMLKARDLCGELSRQVNGNVHQAALTAEAGLAVLLAEFQPEAAESATEPAMDVVERMGRNEQTTKTG